MSRSKNSVQHSVVIVKPEGTGMPSVLISAKFAPFPPSRFFMLALPSVFPAPNEYTYFFAITHTPEFGCQTSN